MEELSDEQLLEELKIRLKEKNRALENQKVLLSELELLNKKLIQAEKVKSGFLSNIRNEVNNPLASIIGLSGQIISQTKLDIDKIRAIAYIINKEAFSLDFQMKNIFSAAEIEAGEIQLKPMNVLISEVIFNQIKYFNDKISDKSITVHYYPEGISQHFITDLYLLENIVMNLLSNAIEYSNKNTEIIISTEVTKEGLTLIVKDFGIGMEEHLYRTAFDRFQQLETGSTKKHQGHGLGLAIIKSYVDGLFGTITINSQKEIFTEVEINLPNLSEKNISMEFVEDDEILFGDSEIL